MDKKIRDRISYVIVDTSSHVLAQAALMHSQLAFPLKNSVVFSDVYEGWSASKFIRIEPIRSLQEYSEFLIKTAWQYVDTEFFIVIQYDGFVLNPDCFLAEFLDFDYIGAVWPHFESYNVGNGGFSLRSTKIMRALNQLIDDETFTLPEDLIICRKYRATLEEKYNINFAPDSIANQFSQELSIQKHTTFGFHGFLLLPLVYRNNLSFLSRNMPKIRNHSKLREFKLGCKLISDSHAAIEHDFETRNLI